MVLNVPDILPKVRLHPPNPEGITSESVTTHEVKAKLLLKKGGGVGERNNFTAEENNRLIAYCS